MITNFVLDIQPQLLGVTENPVPGNNRTIHSFDGIPIGCDWDHEPTQQEQDDLQAVLDSAVADYPAWLAEHGGDSVITNKRIAKERLDDRKELLSILFLVASELNILRNQWRELQAHIAAAANLTDLKTRVGTMPVLDDRTDQQVITAVKNRIDI